MRGRVRVRTHTRCATVGAAASLRLCMIVAANIAGSFSCCLPVQCVQLLFASGCFVVLAASVVGRGTRFKRCPSPPPRRVPCASVVRALPRAAPPGPVPWRWAACGARRNAWRGVRGTQTHSFWRGAAFKRRWPGRTPRTRSRRRGGAEASGRSKKAGRRRRCAKARARGARRRVAGCLANGRLAAAQRRRARGTARCARPVALCALARPTRCRRPDVRCACRVVLTTGLPGDVAPPPPRRPPRRDSR